MTWVAQVSPVLGDMGFLTPGIRVVPRSRNFGETWAPLYSRPLISIRRTLQYSVASFVLILG